MFMVVSLSGPMMFVRSSASVKNLVPKVLLDEGVRRTLAYRILNQVENGAGPIVIAAIEAKRGELVRAISAQLVSPSTVSVLQKDVGIAYDFVATNQPTRTIDIQPLSDSLLSAMGEVDPLYAFVQHFLKDVKPITLTRDASMPNISKWIPIAQYFYLALIIFLAFSLFFYFRFAASAKEAVKGTGIRVLVVGLLAVIEYFVILSIAAPYGITATDTLTMIVPVATHAFFNYYKTLGIAMVVLGALAIFVSTRLRTPTQQLKPAPTGS
jgi:hypothetical protein